MRGEEAEALKFFAVLIAIGGGANELVLVGHVSLDPASTRS